MPKIDFSCPTCSKMLRGDDALAGKAIKCPGCATSVTVPAAPQQVAVKTAPVSVSAAPAAAGNGTVKVTDVEEIDESEPVAPLRKVARRAEEEENEEEEEEAPPSWKWTRLGLLLMFIASCVIIGLLALEQCGRTLLVVDGVRNHFVIASYQARAKKMLTASPQEQMDFWRNTKPPEMWNNTTLSLNVLRVSRVLLILAALPMLVGLVFVFIGPKPPLLLSLLIAVTVVFCINQLLAIIFRIVPLFDNDTPIYVAVHGNFWKMFFYRTVTNAFFVLDPLLGSLLIWSIARELRSKKVARAAMVAVIVTAVFGGIQFLIDLIFSIIEPPTSETGQDIFAILVILCFLGLVLLQMGALAFYTVQMWRVRSVVPRR